MFFLSCLRGRSGIAFRELEDSARQASPRWQRILRTREAKAGLSSVVGPTDKKAFANGRFSNALLNDRSGFLSGNTGVAGKLFHFRCNNGKSPSSLTGPGSLYRGIERKEIGLLGDPAN